MRLDVDYTLVPDVYDFDVLLVDTVGTPFNSFSIANGGLGGSEQQAILLLEGLGVAGYRVGCVNRGPQASRSLNGVSYFPIHDLERGQIAPRCKVLISMRSGFMPDGIEFDRVVFWLHDIPDNNLQNISTYLRDMDDAQIVTVSDWQKSKLPPTWDTRATTIHNQIPDWIYEHKNDGGGIDFVYASAALKGLDATLSAWNALKKKSYFFKKSTLSVLSPGYDKPGDAIKTANGAEFVGSICLRDVVTYITKSRALFYVNTMPETFGLVPLMAEVLGTPTLIFCPGDTGALGELMSVKPCTSSAEFIERCESKSYISPANAHDNLRSSNIIPKWVAFLGLKQ